VTVAHDEALSKIDAAKLRALRPFFKPSTAGGTVTAGNSSPLSDGACALVVASAVRARERGLPALAVVRGYGDANQSPEWFTTAPAAAIPKVCSFFVAGAAQKANEGLLFFVSLVAAT
jgi:acetyl-CoA C-acetyltransferase